MSSHHTPQASSSSDTISTSVTSHQNPFVLAILMSPHGSNFHRNPHLLLAILIRPPVICQSESSGSSDTHLTLVNYPHYFKPESSTLLIRVWLSARACMRVLLFTTPFFSWLCFSASPSAGMAPRRKKGQTSQPMEDDTHDHLSRSMGSSAFQPAMSTQNASTRNAGASQPSLASGLHQHATAQNASNPEPSASQPSAGSAIQPAVAVHMVPRRKRAKTSDADAITAGSAVQPAITSPSASSQNACASQSSSACAMQQAVTAESQPSTGSALQPAANISVASASRPSVSTPAAAAMVRDVLEFGRIPTERKQSSTEEQRKEKLLAHRYNRQKKHMSEDDARKLDQLQVLTKDRATAQNLMARVRDLGHYPSQRTALARQLQEAAALFQPAEAAELEELRLAALGTHSLMAQVRELGHYPNPRTVLARQLQEAAALFEPAEAAELEELRLSAQREQEARQLDTRSLMERVRALGHYPGQGTALARQLQEAAALFQPAEIAELDELRLQEVHVKAAAEAEAQQILEAAQAAIMGDAMYATTEWLKAGNKDLLRVICAWEEADVRPDTTMKLMVAAILKVRRERAGASQPAVCAAALKTAVDGVVVALQPVQEREQCSGPRFNQTAVRALTKLMTLTAAHTQVDQKMRHDLREAVQRLGTEAEAEELDLSLYPGNCKCTVFLHWCIKRLQQRAAEEAQAELEQPVDPMAACADGAQNLIDQDLLQLEAGIRTRPVLRRLQKYVAALQHDFMQQYKARTRNIDPYTIK